MSKNIQLFCIPFAGGSAASFNELCGYLDESIDVHVIEYPGRGTRRKEAFLENIDELIEDVKTQIAETRDTKLTFALFGYSMGTAIAYDLAQFELEEKPVHLFASAREALFHYNKSKGYTLLSTEEFIEKVTALGGIDERICKDKRFLEIYMRPVYADYKLWNQYIYKKEKECPSCNMTVFYCEKDTPYELVEGWNQLTTGNVDFYEYSENHFFIQKHAKEMAEVVNSKLKVFCELL